MKKSSIVATIITILSGSANAASSQLIPNISPDSFTVA
ncbi:protease, partial [Klebsiella pneumoniae]